MANQYIYEDIPELCTPRQCHVCLMESKGTVNSATQWRFGRDTMSGAIDRSTKKPVCSDHGRGK